MTDASINASTVTPPEEVHSGTGSTDHSWDSPGYPPKPRRWVCSDMGWARKAVSWLVLLPLLSCDFMHEVICETLFCNCALTLLCIMKLKDRCLVLEKQVQLQSCKVPIFPCTCAVELSVVKCPNFTETGVWQHRLKMKSRKKEKVAMPFKLDQSHFGAFQQRTFKYPPWAGTVIITWVIYTVLVLYNTVLLNFKCVTCRDAQAHRHTYHDFFFISPLE